MNEKFVITIARGYGSGGRTIGKMLSKNLSIPFYDRDLVYMASEESGINVKLFGQNDESVKKSIFSPASDRYTGDLIPPESSAFVSNKNIFNYQAKIIKDLAVKPSKFVKIGDIILIKNPPIIRTYKILKLIDKRVSAKLVPDLIVETTPQSELDKLKNIETAFIVRDKGSGRPTKKERRLINKIKDDNL